MGFVQEFKDFAMRGNVVDMAVGIVIGGAFGGIVKSFVDDIIMPGVGVITGGIDFADYKIPLKDAVVANEAEGVEAAEAVFMNVGLFANGVINFLIVAMAIFVVIKMMNSLKSKEEEEPEKPAEPPKEELLLTEIRDLLAKK